MIFAHFRTNNNEANVFLVACPETRKAFLIDAGSFDPRIRKFIADKGLQLSGIFITHNHYDHTDGLADMIEEYDPQVFAGISSINSLPAKKLHQDDSIEIGKMQGRCIMLPGHTPESMGLVLPGMVFTGDALFSGSIGGTANIHNMAIEIDHIRRHLFTLPEDYLVHTGHGPTSTIGIEKRHNPFFV
jgi:glyoxylase-like metal-dependent hydrolase (beta-lactamase superfamily II)